MRLAAGVEYDGSGFFGWQRQRQSPTVQECLETALGRVADHPVTVHCAGRTDTGVHAVCQVVHFDTPAVRNERSWVLGTNTHLHPGISLLWAREVDEEFHARFRANRRHYRYRILNRWVRPAIARGRVAWVRHPLDAGRMHEAARALIGEHDFSSFRAVGCQARSPKRTVHRLDVRRDGHELVIDIEANAFVYHMVRNIAGTLIAIGRGERPVSWAADVLAARDRMVAGVTAPAEGLYFLAPGYPDYPELPTHREVGFPARLSQ
ncbi:tRNA pseudouridine(38-40) synthase TruA [Wenzhouxiangella sp. AB-CW3]|uniref:tRNA pseudouridine(38-40) synthase TruA n=1 Tax=Wenzhouxiangella sp. AB-CW3 TaxID=2771012 RepID=UPI00168BB48C|nr:tRNA pseudouridine(38-40) synthase TruA [Wenzhouxiangella sp. AB-CW3]QOC23572.1 tRNA pseudouridine(38-40) synthase TruA [Wenzhouxiangella sp. AB-CW3]